MTTDIDPQTAQAMVSTCIMLEYTENEQLKTKLKNSDQEARRLVDNIPCPIYQLDREMNMLYCNYAYTELAGCKATELLGRGYKKV